MKAYFTIVFILLVGLQAFSKMFVILGYEMNKDFISRALCVNRNQPKSCCHGRCYLNKKLNQEESQQGFPGEKSQKDLSHLRYFAETFMGLADLATVLIPAKNGFYLTGNTQKFVHSHYQPPRSDV
jgi:hypothetical protein